MCINGALCGIRCCSSVIRKIKGVYFHVVILDLHWMIFQELAAKKLSTKLNVTASGSVKIRTERNSYAMKDRVFTARFEILDL